MGNRVRLRNASGARYSGQDFDGAVIIAAPGEEFECSARLAKLLQTFNRAGFEVVGAAGGGVASDAGASGEGSAPTTAGLEAGASGAAQGFPGESGTGSAPAPAPVVLEPGTYTSEELAKAVSEGSGPLATPARPRRRRGRA